MKNKLVSITLKYSNGIEASFDLETDTPEIRIPLEISSKYSKEKLDHLGDHLAELAEKLEPIRKKPPKPHLSSRSENQ